MSEAERLAATEASDVVPSAPLLRRMADKYHRPILTFYLPKVPAPPHLVQDFRTLPDQGDESNVLLASLLRDFKARQALADRCVVTAEVSKPTRTGARRHVPDVCDDCGVNWLSPVAFIAELDFTTDWDDPIAA